MSEAPVLRALLVEDELAAREELKYLLANHPELLVVGEATDGLSGLRLARQCHPDVVFLDIQMPGLDGLSLARRLQEALPEVQLVFATAYDDHAVAAFDLDAIDYLLKPFEPERVARTVARLLAQRSTSAASSAPSTPPAAEPERRLPVQRRHRTFFLEPDEIAWVGMEDGLVTVAAADGTRYGSDLTLRELEQRLDAARFFRCHREAIVNLQRVREVRPHQSGTYRLVLDDVARSEIPLARNRVRRLRDLLPW